jgi:alpha-D-ribose 1-methylphosphonate 5-triphosphate synthase subunit PhnI
MGYVAVKGGIDAIENACKAFLFERMKGTTAPLGVDQIRDQLYLLVDRVMGEGSLYAPDLAAMAVKQAAGDTLEAAFLLRAYRTTRPRLGTRSPSRRSRCASSEGSRRPSRMSREARFSAPRTTTR